MEGVDSQRRKYRERVSKERKKGRERVRGGRGVPYLADHTRLL